MPRKKKALAIPTTASTDKEIVSFLSAINNKLSGYYKVAGDDVGEQMSDRVQQVLTFKKWRSASEGGGVVEESLPMDEGKILLRKKADKEAAVAYIRKVLGRQEQKIDEARKVAAAMGEAYPEELRSKTITETLAAIPTVQEKLEKAKSDLAASKAMSGETLRQGDDEKKRAFNRRAKDMAIRELQARAERTYSESFSDVISKLYEEYGANEDIISQLKSDRWTGEIMEEANLRAMGIHVTRR